MLETSVRVLRLLSLLTARRSWRGADLAERLEVSTRTIRHDVDRLRTLGYEVASSSGPTGGYRLSAGSTLPPLLLDDEEAVAVAVGLLAAAAASITGIEETSLRALVKLEQTLPARLRHRVEVLRSATTPAPHHGPRVNAGTLSAIATATQRRERLRLDYADHHGACTVREVEPHRLVHTGRRWYLLAWDTHREDWRTFRADRITLRSPNGPRFIPREPPDPDVGAHVLRRTASAAWAHPARVRLHAPITAMAELIPPTGGLLSALDASTCLLETGGPTLTEVAGFLLSLDVDLAVEDPPELRAVLRRLGERCAAAALADPPQP